ncbi:transcription factor bHLH30-like [Populus alba x Populus x berolinensis]|uniref:Transcription factor bHLH30-like n=1 Tax=Populus alba x Populus x berolinensis TaxID=444605 RepID=A0AAD6MM55_9ROSI|nr:transcription factor bHLH30-like [Populus alba x Populus x berolinensis]
MCGLKEEDQEEQTIHNLQNYQEQLLFQYHQQMQQHHQQQSSDIYGGARGSGLIFPEVSPILPWPLPPAHSFNSDHFTSNHPVRDHDPFLIPPPIPSSYGGLFNRRSPSLQFAYDGTSSDHLRIISETLGPVVQPVQLLFGLQAELSRMTAQEIMDAKALAASKSHSEAERRRRERINNHLAKLRSLLPSTTKTDKASLLAEVIQHVKELKRQTSLIAETSPVPTEMDELTVDTADEDALRLRTLKAEITTLGGRVKNVLFIAGEEDSSSDSNDHQQQQQPLQYSISSIQEALKSVMEKTGGDDFYGEQRGNDGILVCIFGLTSLHNMVYVEKREWISCGLVPGGVTFPFCCRMLVQREKRGGWVETGRRGQALDSKENECIKLSSN